MLHFDDASMFSDLGQTYRDIIDLRVDSDCKGSKVVCLDKVSRKVKSNVAQSSAG